MVLATPPAVLLVRPQEQGNIGAAARAMANMGLDRLLVVEPAAPFGPVARAFAVGAAPLLERAERWSSLRDAVAGFERVVGTTSGRERIFGTPLLTPRELGHLLAADPPDLHTILVFGPEVSGLTREELALCGVLVRVPSTAIHPTLNVAQAALILAYESFLARELPSSPAVTSTPAASGEVATWFQRLAALLHTIGFARDDTYAGVERDLRQLLARAAPSRREVAILHGMLRRLEHALGVRRKKEPGASRW